MRREINAGARRRYLIWTNDGEDRTANQSEPVVERSVAFLPRPSTCSRLWAQFLEEEKNGMKRGAEWLAVVAQKLGGMLNALAGSLVCRRAVSLATKPVRYLLFLSFLLDETAGIRSGKDRKSVV